MEDSGAVSVAPDAEAVLRIKVWLIGISPMVWRRVLVPAVFTLHGVIQVAMGWEGFHLFQFCLRSVRYGSWELSTSSPDITLAALRLRKGARFIYEYDLNIPWRHEVRIEDLLAPEAGKTYPICVAGDGACPPEDCGRQDAFMENRDDILSFDSRDDLATMAEIVGDITRERRLEILDDAEVRIQVPAGETAPVINRILAGGLRSISAKEASHMVRFILSIIVRNPEPVQRRRL